MAVVEAMWVPTPTPSYVDFPLNACAQTSVKAATAKTAQIIGFSNLITVMVILQPGTKSLGEIR